MTGSYANFGGLPRATIRQVVRPVGKQIAFSMGHLGLGPSLDPKRSSSERNAAIRAWTDDFVRRHQAELDAVPRPSGFVAGDSCGDIDAAGCDVKRWFPDAYQVCEDPILTVAILGRVSGNLYIPRREIRLSQALFSGSLAFPAKYFPPQFRSMS